MSSHPLALIAEITHRCPLHCVYCSNPLEMVRAQSELATEAWVRVFQEAAQLGVLHLHLTGGEPLARTDLAELITAAHSAGLYTNLITSGVGLSEDRLQQLVNAGLDHIQISFQDSREDAANWIGGAKAQSQSSRSPIPAPAYRRRRATICSRRSRPRGALAAAGWGLRSPPN